MLCTLCYVLLRCVMLCDAMLCYVCMYVMNVMCVTMYVCMFVCNVM